MEKPWGSCFPAVAISRLKFFDEMKNAKILVVLESFKSCQVCQTASRATKQLKAKARWENNSRNSFNKGNETGGNLVSIKIINEQISSFFSFTLDKQSVDDLESMQVYICWSVIKIIQLIPVWWIIKWESGRVKKVRPGNQILNKINCRNIAGNSTTWHLGKFIVTKDNSLF